MKLSLTLAIIAALFAAGGMHAADKKIVLIAGKPSHGPGAHEHRAGCRLFQQCLTGFPGAKVVVYDGGWPTKQVDGKTVDDDAALDDAAAIVFYSDGGEKHPALVGDRLAVLGRQVKRGAGIGAIHYAVEPTKERGQAEWID